MGRPGAGDFFGSYHLLDEIGRGGCATVYRARHVHPAYAEQLFAIKRLQPAAAADAEVVARFRREVYLLSMLEHPNIVKTFAAGTEGDELFIASEYIDGHDLTAVLQRQHGKPMPVYLAVYIAG
jgi:serine/threonine protein kinase